MRYTYGFIIWLFSLIAQANSLLELTDDQFVRLLGSGIPDECFDYYSGDMTQLSTDMNELMIIDSPGQHVRSANSNEQQDVMNTILGTLENRCYQDVKRVIVTNNYYSDMPKHLYADDFQDIRVLERYSILIKGEK